MTPNNKLCKWCARDIKVQEHHIFVDDQYTLLSRGERLGPLDYIVMISGQLHRGVKYGGPSVFRIQSQTTSWPQKSPRSKDEEVPKPRLRKHKWSVHIERKTGGTLVAMGNKRRGAIDLNDCGRYREWEEIVDTREWKGPKDVCSSVGKVA